LTERIRPSVAWLRVALVLIGVLVADQLSKRAITDSITPGDTRNVLPGVQFVDTRNHGVAFGLLTGNQAIVVAFIGAALLALLVYFARHTTRQLAWLPTGLLIGGALGNILDRVRDGSVTDFIKLPLGWPPFNLADMAITFGVLSLAYVLEGPRPDDAPPGHSRPDGLGTAE
jgi:signal peptidase II